MPMTNPQALLRLVTWLSPAFPVGSFSYSHGIEQAVEAGLLTGRADTEAWIGHILRHGAGWVDAGLFLAAHRACVGGADLGPVLAQARAQRGSAEMALEASAQGRAFVATLRAVDPACVAWAADPEEAPSHAVAVGAASAQAGVDEETALILFLAALGAALVSAAVRLVPLGQTDGQRITAALNARIPSWAAAARALPPEDLGSAAPMVDWTSMTHETQYTRLFRS